MADEPLEVTWDDYRNCTNEKLRAAILRVLEKRYVIHFDDNGVPHTYQERRYSRMIHKHSRSLGPHERIHT